MVRSGFVAFVLLIVASSNALAADWPEFRGPARSGVAEDDAPTVWGPDENIRWKVDLPSPGNGSPIVVGDRVFVTATSDGEGQQRSLLCFDANSGDRLWTQTVNYDAVAPTHETNPYSGTTPASDGERVVVWHASAGLHCYDLDGKSQWSRDLGRFRHTWGYGSSPIIHKGRVYLQTGPGERVFVTAIDLASGETIWETDEPSEGTPDRNAEGQYKGSWSSPIVVQVDGKDQVVVAMPTRVNAYDPETGDIIWTCNGLRHDRGDLAYSSPVVVGDICFVTGGFRGPAMAIRLGGTGDITATHRLWRSEKQPQSIGSGVVVDDYVYRPNAGPGTLQCIDPTTGKILWTERGAGDHWASLVMAGGLLYATAQNGTTIVFRPNPEKLDVVSKNALSETCNATPAIANGKVYIRTANRLYCIQQ